MTDPREAPRAIAQAGMIREIVPENVIERTAERCAISQTVSVKWKSRRIKSKGHREDLGQNVNTEESMHQKNFGTFCRDAFSSLAGVQSKSCILPYYDDHE